MSDEGARENVMRRRRQEPSLTDEIELSARWRKTIESYRSVQSKESPYPRRHRLLDIVLADGRVKLMLDYDEENPDPDLTRYGERRQVESLLGFEAPLEKLIADAESRWRAGDFAGEAAVLEEFANSNPQKDAILGLAAEARREALSGASTTTRPKRR